MYFRDRRADQQQEHTHQWASQVSHERFVDKATQAELVFQV